MYKRWNGIGEHAISYGWDKQLYRPRHIKYVEVLEEYRGRKQWWKRLKFWEYWDEELLYGSESYPLPFRDLDDQTKEIFDGILKGEIGYSPQKGWKGLDLDKDYKTGFLERLTEYINFI